VSQNIEGDEGNIYVKGSKTCTARTLDLKPSQILLIQNYMETSRKALLKSSCKNLIVTIRGVAETVDGVHSLIEPLKALYPDRTYPNYHTAKRTIQPVK
jgi:integrase/recombinase XerD